jgi:hypothetical protein
MPDDKRTPTLSDSRAGIAELLELAEFTAAIDDDPDVQALASQIQTLLDQLAFAVSAPSGNRAVHVPCSSSYVM